jgi:hypothetical protein
MTEEEAYALDEYVSTHEITLEPNGTDWLAQREMRLMGLSHTAVTYLMTKAKALNKSPAQLINEMVAKEIAAAAEPVAV